MRPQFLSLQQLHDFERDGFLLIHKPIESKEMDQIVSWVNEVQGYPEEPGKYMMYNKFLVYISKATGRIIKWQMYDSFW